MSTINELIGELSELTYEERTRDVVDYIWDDSQEPMMGKRHITYIEVKQGEPS